MHSFQLLAFKIHFFAADNDESDLKEELYACKEATRKLLEKMREFQG